jgi:rRNA maturation protein Nop10
MFEVCPACGLYSVEKTIAPAGPLAICPHCGHAQPFLRLPLFIVTGASGAGKTTACLALVGQLPECVVLDSDILWDARFNTPEDNYRAYRALWLSLARDIGQNGRPVMLFGSAVPEQFEDLPGRRYFSAIHYLALVCEDTVLVERLHSRPAWREAGSPQFIASMLAFNRWFYEHAATTQPPITLHDTGHSSPAATPACITAWIRRHLDSPAAGP